MSYSLPSHKLTCNCNTPPPESHDTFLTHDPSTLASILSRGYGSLYTCNHQMEVPSIFNAVLFALNLGSTQHSSKAHFPKT